MKMKKNKFLISLILLFAFIGCGKQTSTTPIRKDIIDIVFASGNIQTEDEYYVTAQSEGYLVKSFVEEGDTVKKGEFLFQIDDETQKVQLESSIATFNYATNNKNPNSEIFKQLNAQKMQTKNKLVKDSLDFKRYENLIKTKAVSLVDFERAKLNFENSKQTLISLENEINDLKNNLNLEYLKAKSNLVAQQNTNSFYKPTSLVDGIVLQILKENGELVRRGETIAKIGSGNFIAKLFVSEDDINLIKIGQDVFIELNTEKSKSYKGKITKVLPQFDSKEQSFLVEARFVDATNLLKSGTQLQANIVVGKKENALVIPSAYIINDNYVFEKGNDEKKRIEIGIKTPDWTEVLDGIYENSILVLQN